VPVLKVKKERIDKLLVLKGLAESREKAKAMIMAGEVFVNGTRVEKPGSVVPEDAEIVIKKRFPYVSRGGLKLETALKSFSIDVSGFVCLDIGASTGGFTDCLLKHGAEKVYSVDVGKGLLDQSLRNNERVVVIEGVNARYLSNEHVPEKVDLITIDVSFISLEKILPVAKNFLKESGKIVALVKPQFEVGKREAKRFKGVIKDPCLHSFSVKKIAEFSKKLGLIPVDVALSYPPGPKGNKEFFLLLAREGKPVEPERIDEITGCQR
jgi:23S rRNA (cytidine1920-2'-O)/16S rRNA (cytidine1409-2'-O)-methyltransferase